MTNDDEECENSEEKSNREAPILLKDFECTGWTINKSYLIKQNDLELASFQRDHNSISIISAIKMRWKVCIPNDIPRCKQPIAEFLKDFGLVLWIDMDEVVEIREPATLGRYKEWREGKLNTNS